MSPSVTCGNATTGSPLTITENDGAPCTFTVSAAGATAIAGTFTLAADNMLLGRLTPGIAMAASCSGSFMPATPSFTIICGGCVVNLRNVP